jgi:predicted permease
MLDILVQLAPIFFYFLIGVVLRHVGLADRNHGDFLLRLVFFVSLPLLILLTLSNAALTADKIMLPLANIIVNVLCLGSMFLLAVYGDSGFADAVLYDFGNAIMVATVTFTMAFRYSDEPYQKFAMVRRIAGAPLFWALCLGVSLSVLGIAIPRQVVAVVSPVANMMAPLILIALGIFFSFTLRQIRLVGLALFIRMGLGLAFGVSFAWLVGLDGQAFLVVALCSGAPIGFMALTFTSMAKLDTELTASAVSLSILAGLVYVPLLMFVFRSVSG